MIAKKRKWNVSSNYLITLEANNPEITSKGYIGKLRSNFMGTEYHLYSNGLNPKKKEAEISNVREEMATIIYV